VGGAWERRHDREKRVREDVYPSFRGVECSNEKLKIERATNSLTAIRVLAGTKNSRPVGFYSRNSTKSTVNPNTTIPQIRLINLNEKLSPYPHL
jgi:hypothetical protein